MKVLTQAVIEELIKATAGSFNVRDIWAELGITHSENKQHLRVILNRLSQAGIIAKTSKDGTYRKIDEKLEPVDWQNADPTKTVKVAFPFSVEALCKVYPKSIIIVAGEKNAGKTAFLYQMIQLNMANHIIDLFNSETGPEQMQERFEPLDIPEPAPFNVYERYDNFADVVDPEHLTVIDYLDLNSEFYLVGAEIDSIFRKLTTGVAVIGLQKPPPTIAYVKGKRVSYSRDLAYGGGTTAKRAIIFISLGDKKMKLVYVKTPSDPKVNPNNMMWSYSFDGGGYFTNIKRYYPSDIQDDD